MRVKSGLADMLKGGVIMDVTNAEQAKIAEEAGAVRRHGARAGTGRHPRATAAWRAWPTPLKIKEIRRRVSIPVMAKARIGHFVEAQILEALEVDYIDESEVLTPADEAHHIDKWKFNVPFVCGAIDLGEALRRISEGAAMIRTKGEAGTGDVVEAVRHMRTIMGDDPAPQTLDEDELYNVAAKELRAPLRPGALGRRERQAAGRQLLRRRHRHARRRGPDDAARRRGGLRGLGHLQERRPAESRRGDRHAPRPTTTTPPCWPRSRSGWATPWRASRRPRWRRREDPVSAAGRGAGDVSV